MYCTKCGEKLEPNAAYCTACGVPVMRSDPQRQQSFGRTKQPSVQKKTGNQKKRTETDNREKRTAQQTEQPGFSNLMFAMDSPSSVPRHKKTSPVPPIPVSREIPGSGSKPQTAASGTAQTVSYSTEESGGNVTQSGAAGTQNAQEESDSNSKPVSNGIPIGNGVTPQKKNSAKPKTVGVIAGVAALAAAVAIVSLSGNGSKESSSSVVTVAATAAAAVEIVTSSEEREEESIQPAEETAADEMELTAAAETEAETEPAETHEEVTTEATTEAMTTEAVTEETTTKQSRNGWIQENGRYYFYRDDKPVKESFVNDGGNTYYMASDGSMSIGWVQVNGKYYYADGSGRIMSNGWIPDGGDYYYMDANGVMQTGWVSISGKWYYLGSNGKNRTEGWQNIDGQEYYFDANGALLTDATTPDGRRVDADGHPVADDNTVYAADTPESLSGYYSYIADDYLLSIKFSEDGTFQGRRRYNGKTNDFTGKYRCDPENNRIKISGCDYLRNVSGYYDIEMVELEDRETGYVAIFRD